MALKKRFQNVKKLTMTLECVVQLKIRLHYVLLPVENHKIRVPIKISVLWVEAKDL